MSAARTARHRPGAGGDSLVCRCRRVRYSSSLRVLAVLTVRCSLSLRAELYCPGSVQGAATWTGLYYLSVQVMALEPSMEERPAQEPAEPGATVRASTSVVLVDDPRTLLDLLGRAIAGQDDIDVLGTATTAAEGLALVD